MHVPQTEVILKHDSVELAHVTVPPGEYVIGRSAEVEIHAETPLLSRRHAKLTIQYDQLFLQDLGSSNGTFVNDQQVNEITRLFPNQSIRLGPDITLEVRRLRTPTEPDLSLTPKQAAIRRFLPEELLTDKRYAIGSQIAQGGMGAILDAKQTATQRTVAMKVMLGATDEGDVLRFIEEAQVTAQLEHPNIVPVHELGVDEQDQVFYTMKMVRGITLKKVLDLLAQEVPDTLMKYPLPALLTIFQKVCDAIAFAHSRGVIHRDLKPENIMLDDFGVVLVMDWGLAKIFGTNGDSAGGVASVHSARAAEPSFGSTMTGTIMGTPQYMSPEQARGEVEDLDARSDIFTLGAILYRILTLRPHVAGRTAAEIVEKTGRGESEALISPKKEKGSHLPGGQIPDSLAAVVSKAMALDKTSRYQRVSELQRDLNAYQTGFATSAENAGAWKQFTLLVKRHKATATAAILVFLTVLVFGTKAVVAEKRAERDAYRARVEADRANEALSNLRRSAPALLQLAKSEAATQHFDSALQRLDAAITIDPELIEAYWRRGWILLAQDRLPEAIGALSDAQRHDPKNEPLATLLPIVQKLADVPVGERRSREFCRPIYDYLTAAGAIGEATPFIQYLMQTGAQRLELVQAHLKEWLGNGPFSAEIDARGALKVVLNGTRLGNLKPLRGLPIEALSLAGCDVDSLEPLRGMPLVTLDIEGNPRITDLSPLRGMALSKVVISRTGISDIAPLKGMPLKAVILDENVRLFDLSPLTSAPLNEIEVANATVVDFSFLVGMPLHAATLFLDNFDDLKVLKGMPLERLAFNGYKTTDFSPLLGLPLKTLRVNSGENADFSLLLNVPTLETLSTSVSMEKLLAIRMHPNLKLINYKGQGFRPVADFWQEYDAQHPAKKK